MLRLNRDKIKNIKCVHLDHDIITIKLHELTYKLATLRPKQYLNYKMCAIGPLQK